MVRKKNTHVVINDNGKVVYIATSETAFTEYSVARKPDPYSESSTQLLPLGTKLEYNERVFRYSKNGGVAGVAGNLYQAPVPAAGDIDEALSTPSAGDFDVDITQTSGGNYSANAYAEGYFSINDDTGEGYIHRIRTHGTLTTSVASTITLYDAIVVALGASATGTITINPYSGLIIHPSPNTARVVGVMQRAMTASYFGWTQVRGPAAVLTEGTLVIGKEVMASITTNGAVAPKVFAQNSTGTLTVGNVMTVNGTGEYSQIWLTIE